MITYLLWQCRQLEGIIEEGVSGTMMLKRKIFEKFKKQKNTIRSLEAYKMLL